MGGKEAWIARTRGKPQKTKIHGQYNWVPIAIVKCLNECKSTNYALPMKDIQDKIQKSYPNKCDDNDKNRQGQIKWKQNINKYLYRYPCFEQVEDPNQPKRNPIYRLLLEYIKGIGDDVAILESGKKYKKKGVAKRMNYIKAF